MPIIEGPAGRLSEPTRAWIYRIALAATGLLVMYGAISEAEAAQWALLVAAILGLGTETLAAANTSTKVDADG